MLFRGEKLIIPELSREEILDKLHEGHLGQKCKVRARQMLYWPNMTRDIEMKVKKCKICAKFRNQNPKEPLMPHPIPDTPWTKLGGDIFDYGDRSYLLIVDYFSKYPKIAELKQKTGEGIIRAPKPILGRHGIPEILMGDNMPFASTKVRQFAAECGFRIVTSSPRYPQSNGQAERFVGTVKALLRKPREEGIDPNKALLQYRNAPIVGIGYSPAQLLFNRRLQDDIPVSKKLLYPRIPESAIEKLLDRQDQQKKHYDKRTKIHQKFKPGENITARIENRWVPARIEKEHYTPRSFIVMTEKGQKYRWNRRFLNKSENKVDINPPYPERIQEENYEKEMPDQTVEPLDRSERTQPEVPDEPKLPEPAEDRPRRNRKPPKWHKDYIVNN